MLVDNVSKNGNLLLNVVQRPDGSLDPEVETMLGQLADWNAIHGEAIFGTRPWLVYGESSVKVKGGAFKEDFKYNAREIRFTTKGKTLYAIALGWPEDGHLLIRSLAKPAGENVNNITAVNLLGYGGKIEWRQTAEGLSVALPAERISEFTAALQITGTQLQHIPFTVPVQALVPDVQGNLKLGADDAELHGDQIKTENQGGQPNIGFWDKADEWVSWRVRFPQPSTFEVTAECAAANGGTEFVIEIAGQKLAAKSGNTGSWDKFETVKVGRVEVSQTGEQTIAVRPREAATWKAMNLRRLKLAKSP
jgi:alpha-L-fucosidase